MIQQGNPKTAAFSGKKTETMEDKNQEPHHRAEHCRRGKSRTARPELWQFLAWLL